MQYHRWILKYIIMAGCAITMLCLMGSQLLAYGDDSPPVLSVSSSAQAAYTQRFSELGAQRPLTFLLYDLNTDRVLANVDATKQMPVVSAVKGPVLMYFMDHVPQDIWGDIPVVYWNERDIQRVPPHYRNVWQQHHVILSELYRMIVYSDNVATGNSLWYAHQYTPYVDLNPVEAFNQWSYEVVNISTDSGIREWDEGATGADGWLEARFDGRMTVINRQYRFYNNTFSAVDMARYYYWLYWQDNVVLFSQAQALMSVVEGYPGFLEHAAQQLNARPVSKDGFVGPGDRANRAQEYLTADGGLILLPEGAGLIVISMAVNGGDKLSAIYDEVAAIVRQERNELYWPQSMDYIAWMRSDSGPYGQNSLSGEGAYFIKAYLEEQGNHFASGQSLETLRPLFLEAYAMWFSVFPGDVIPANRNSVQNRVLSVRYSLSNENLHDILAGLEA